MQTGYLNPGSSDAYFTGGYGGNAQPRGAMNYNAPQYQVNYNYAA